MTLDPNTRAALLKGGCFVLRVMPSSEWIAIRSDQHQALPWHESVLRPLLAATTEAWAYEIKLASRVHQVAGTRLRLERGKYRIDLTGDAIRGHELLWNASGGQRGSIALVVPRSRWSHTIYENCQRAFVLGNSTVPHTPAAVRLARAKAQDGEHICCLLSRTNGFEWISVYAAAPDLEALFQQARALVTERAATLPGAA